MGEKIILGGGYELDLDAIPTVRDIIALASPRWFPKNEDERALKRWAQSVGWPRPRLRPEPPDVGAL